MSLADYDALRSGRGLVVRSDRGRLTLTGPDRRSFLQGLVTNDVEPLRPGQSCYAAMLTPQGRMIADLYAHELDDRMLLDVPAELAATLAARLDQLIFSEDVAVQDVSPDWTHLTAPDTGTAPVPTPIMARGLPFEVPLMDLIVPTVGGVALLEALAAAGIEPVRDEALEILRIEAGVPRWGADLDEETIPLEAGLEQRAISLTKGCYVGQEVIIRVLHRGHGRVARRLVRLSLPDATADNLPPPGDALKHNGRDAGRLTSVAWSPRERAIALGYVHRDLVATGTEVTSSAGRAVVRG